MRIEDGTGYTLGIILCPPTALLGWKPQFQYQKENCQAANHSLSLTNRISWNSLGGGNLFVDIESRD